MGKRRHGDDEREAIRKEVERVMGAMESSLAAIRAEARKIEPERRGPQFPEVGAMWDAIEKVTQPLADAIAHINSNQSATLKALEAAVVAIAVDEERRNPPGESDTWSVKR